MKISHDKTHPEKTPGKPHDQHHAAPAPHGHQSHASLMAHEEKITLPVTLRGNGRSLSLKNPVITASGTFGYGLEFAPFGNLNDLGAITVKGLSLRPRSGNPTPRIAETPQGMLNAIGLQNAGVEKFIKNTLPRIRAVSTVPVIVNLYATSSAEFGELAGILASTEGVAAIEVNISCPNVKEGGVAFGQDPSMAQEVTEAVMKTTGSLPVIVKLSPNVTDITAIARACEAGGATAVSLINTLKGMALDLQSRRPRLSTTIGGLSGPAIKPVALRCVYETAQAVKIPVIGMGGIVTAQDALEFILAGAYAIQVGTANFMRPDTAFAIAASLQDTMEKYRIDSLDNLRGAVTLFS